MSERLPVDQPHELIEQFSDLANVLRSEETLERVLRHVAESAESTIAACDGASVSIDGDDGVATVAASGDFAERLDGAQYATDEGPCLAAIRAGTMVRMDDVDTDERWPAFGDHAAREGLRAVLSLPLVAREQVVGSLNLYSRTAPFREADERIGGLFALQAALGLANVEAQQQTKAIVDQLTQALESRDVIGQAKGILMARERCTSDEAFDILRRASQRMNTKLRDVAEQIVRSVSEGTGGEPKP